MAAVADWNDVSNLSVRVELRRLRDDVTVLKPSEAAQLGHAEVVWAGLPERMSAPSTIVLPPVPAGGLPRGIDEIGITLRQTHGGSERRTNIVLAANFERGVAIQLPSGGSRPLRPLEPIDEGTVLAIDASASRCVSVTRSSVVRA